MSQPLKLIKQPQTVSTARITVCRNRAEFKSQMVMVRYHSDLVIEEKDRERAEYIYSQLMEQCRKLSRNFGFQIEKL